MKTFGLIGYPLSHSFSQKYFTEKFTRLAITDSVYQLFPIENISSFPKLLEQTPTLVGLNVTIPYKEAILPYLTSLDESARHVGAVNAIRVSKNEDNTPVLTGYNTDVYGFKQAIKPFLEAHHTKALILGTGGASKAVIQVLKEIGIDFIVASRNTNINGNHTTIGYTEINQHVINAFPLIINTTPLGMYPNIENCPAIPYEYITDKHFLFDLVYNPEETLFLQKGKAQGALIQNGLTMLYQQAEKAWEIWNKKNS
jgi:shikimate dehydrogenase